MREERRERGEPKASFQDIQSSAGRFSSSKEQKFIASTRVTCGCLKTWDFVEDPSEEFGKSKVSSLRSVYEAS